MSGIICLDSSDSESPSLEEIYQSETPKVNKNKNKTKIAVNNSDSDDLPDFDFTENGEISTNQITEEPCSSYHTSELLLQNIIPQSDISMVSDDVRITSDVNLSINRYFDGSLTAAKQNIPDQSNPETESDFTPLSPREFSMNHHSNPQIFHLEDEPSNSRVAKSLFIDTKCVNKEVESEGSDEFTLFFSPLSNKSFDENSKDNIVVVNKTKSVKRKQDSNRMKQKEVEKLNRNEQHIRKYTIKTTTNFDKQILLHLKNGLSTNDILFETCESEFGLEFLFWECESSNYILSEQNEIQKKRKRIEIDYICLLFSVKTFSDQFHEDQQFLEKVLPKLPQSKYLILFYDVKEYFSNLKIGDLPKDRFDNILTQFQVKLHITSHLSNTKLEASDILVRIMRGVRGIATKKEKIFNFSVNSPRKGRKIKTDEERTNLWRNQLIQIPRVSENIANAIIDKYPTPRELKIAFDTSVSEMEKKELLKDILVVSEESKQRRIGSKISEKIFLVFKSKDSEIKI